MPRKRFGQHFLRDESVIQHIIRAFLPKPNDKIIEIGPGDGALTMELLSQLGHLEVIELDRDLIPELAKMAKPIGKLTIHQADALKFDFSKLTSNPSSLRIIGNLPYNISTPLLFHLLEQAHLIQDMLFMLQKEVADRMVAKPNHKSYGRLSIMVQYFCETEILFDVPPTAFYPPPKVESSIIHLIPYQKLPVIAQDFALFTDIVRLAFNQRRKTLRNSLHELITQELLLSLNINPDLRAENLSVEDYVTIANALAEKKK